MANDALSDLLTTENDFKINRAEMPILITCPQKQDYLFAGACAFSLGSTSQGWAIDLAAGSVSVTAGVVTVNTLENHRFAVGDTIYITGVVMATGTTAKYNSTFTDNGSSSAWSVGWVITTIAAKSFTFAATAGQNNADAGAAPGILDYGSLTSASRVQMTDVSSPQYVLELNVFREQPVTSKVANPEKVAVMSDNQAGVLKIRFYFCPGSTTWGANLVYQKAAPVKQSLSDNWSPFPDHYSALYRQAVLYRMYRYLNAPQQNAEYQKLQEEIKKIQAADDTEETSVSVKPEEGLMDAGWGW